MAAVDTPEKLADLLKLHQPESDQAIEAWGREHFDELLELGMDPDENILKYLKYMLKVDTKNSPSKIYDAAYNGDVESFKYWIFQTPPDTLNPILQDIILDEDNFPIIDEIAQLPDIRELINDIIWRILNKQIYRKKYKHPGNLARLLALNLADPDYVSKLMTEALIYTYGPPEIISVILDHNLWHPSDHELEKSLNGVLEGGNIEKFRLLLTYDAGPRKWNPDQLLMYMMTERPNYYLEFIQHMLNYTKISEHTVRHLIEYLCDRVLGARYVAETNVAKRNLASFLNLAIQSGKYGSAAGLKLIAGKRLKLRVR